MKGICKIVLTIFAILAIAGCQTLNHTASIPLPSFANSTLISGTMPEYGKSKVVLIHFFTATSIGSERVAKQVQALSSHYAKDELSSIFVMVPEYEYSKDVTFASKQAKKLNIESAVVFDNSYALWSTFMVTKCGMTLLAKDGMTKKRFDPKESVLEIEESINALLGFENANIFAKTAAVQFKSVQCGYLSGGIGNYSGIELETIYSFDDPKSYKPNKVYLSGEWFLGQEMAWHNSSSDNGGASISFEGSEVFVTMRSQSGGTLQVKVWLDGAPIPDELAGDDVANSHILVSEGRPYSIARNLNKSRQHVITIESASNDWAVYNLEIF